MNGILGLVVMVLDIIAIVDVVKTGKPAGQKVLWILLVLFLPLFGMAAYFLLGRKNSAV